MFPLDNAQPPIHNYNRYESPFGGMRMKNKFKLFWLDDAPFSGFVSIIGGEKDCCKTLPGSDLSDLYHRLS